MWVRLPIVCACLCLACATGCMAGSHRAAVSNEDKGSLTVGTVQREIKVGMTNAEVVDVLGAPNIVTTDEQRRENWVYDKISTEKAYSNSSGYGTLLLIGGEGSSGASSTTQKTLTIIIKFDENGKVRDFAYHASKF